MGTTGEIIAIAGKFCTAAAICKLVSNEKLGLGSLGNPTLS